MKGHFMRALVSLCAAALLTGAVAAPVAAGSGKKKIRGSFTAEALPFPNYSGYTGTQKPGCTAGIEDVHWSGHALRTPGDGILEVKLEGFAGDWDIYVFDEDGVVLAKSDASQIPEGAAEQEELVVPLRANADVLLAACNWLGEPGPLEVTYRGTFEI